MTQSTPPSALDRLWNSFRALVRAELPTLTFLGTYEYSVTATDGTNSSPATTVDCEPTDRSISLPALSKVPVRLPFGVTPPKGALCSVRFLNGDPSKPFVDGFNDPMTLMVFAAGKLPAARQGDMVAVTLYDPTSAASVAVMTALAPHFVASPGGGPCSFFPAGAPAIIYGLVSSGNTQVKE